MSTTIFETERLLLREFSPDDTDFIVQLLNTEGWLRYCGDRNVHSPEDAKAYLENGPWKSYVENGFGLWMVERKLDGQALGMCGILKREGLEQPDIGFAFLPDYFGQGYAHEAARGTLTYAHEVLGLTVLSAITEQPNASSIRVLEKIGLRYLQMIRLPDDETDLMLFQSPQVYSDMLNQQRGTT